MKKIRMLGFTLIELIIVIVILGILAATAMPKFIDLTKDARLAVLKGYYASVQSTINMLNGKCMADPTCSGATTSVPQSVTANGVTVQMYGDGNGNYVPDIALLRNVAAEYTKIFGDAPSGFYTKGSNTAKTGVFFAGFGSSPTVSPTVSNPAASGDDCAFSYSVANGLSPVPISTKCGG